MLRKQTLITAVLAAVFLLVFLVRQAPALRHMNEDVGSKWSAKAEEQFYLTPGMAEQLMTQNEWQNHESNMKDMSPDQLGAYRKLVHMDLMRRSGGVAGFTVPPNHGKAAARATDVGVCFP